MGAKPPIATKLIQKLLFTGRSNDQLLRYLDNFRICNTGELITNLFPNNCGMATLHKWGSRGYFEIVLAPDRRNGFELNDDSTLFLNIFNEQVCSSLAHIASNRTYTLHSSTVGHMNYVASITRENENGCYEYKNDKGNWVV